MAALTVDFRKHSGPTPADDTAAQTITDCGNFTLTSRTWILCLSSLPPDSGTLSYKWNAKCTFIWKEDFGPLSKSPVLFLLSPGKMLLTVFLVQKWFGSSFPEDVWAWWLLTPASVHSLWSSLKCLNRLCLTVFSSLRLSLLRVHIF